MPWESESHRPPIFGRIRSLLGLLAFVGYGAFHLWEQMFALAGRESYVQRFGADRFDGASAILEGCLIGIPFVVYLFTEIMPAAPTDPSEGTEITGANGFDRLRRLSAFGSLAFIVSHVIHLIGRRAHNPALGQSGFEVLRWDLGVWWVSWAYAFGLTAVCCQAAFVCLDFARQWFLKAEPRFVRVMGVVGSLVAATLWGFAVRLLSYFATGVSWF